MKRLLTVALTAGLAASAYGCAQPAPASSAEAASGPPPSAAAPETADPSRDHVSRDSAEVAASSDLIFDRHAPRDPRPVGTPPSRLEDLPVPDPVTQLPDEATQRRFAADLAAAQERITAERDRRSAAGEPGLDKAEALRLKVAELAQRGWMPAFGVEGGHHD